MIAKCSYDTIACLIAEPDRLPGLLAASTLLALIAGGGLLAFKMRSVPDMHSRVSSDASSAPSSPRSPEWPRSPRMADGGALYAAPAMH